MRALYRRWWAACLFLLAMSCLPPGPNTWGALRKQDEAKARTVYLDDGATKVKVTVVRRRFDSAQCRVYVKEGRSHVDGRPTIGNDGGGALHWRLESIRVQWENPKVLVTLPREAHLRCVQHARR
jgi:hypothetical protein